MGNSKITVRDLNGRMRLSSKLAHGFNYFRHAASVGGMVIAKPAAVRIKGELSDTGDEIAIGDKFATLSFGAKPEILKLH